MPAKLDGTTLVDIDVPRLDREHTLIGVQHGVDHRGIGLGTTYQEKDVGTRLAAGETYLLLCRIAVMVKSVSGSTLVVGREQAFQDGLMATVIIITLK